MQLKAPELPSQRVLKLHRWWFRDKRFYEDQFNFQKRGQNAIFGGLGRYIESFFFTLTEAADFVHFFRLTVFSIYSPTFSWIPNHKIQCSKRRRIILLAGHLPYSGNSSRERRARTCKYIRESQIGPPRQLGKIRFHNNCEATFWKKKKVIKFFCPKLIRFFFLLRCCQISVLSNFHSQIIHFS